MLDNFELETFIKNSIKIIVKKLNLTIPYIEFKEYKGVGYFKCIRTINISLKTLKKICNKWDKDLCPLKLTTYLDRIYFIIAHEVGHYFQHCKFPKWFRRYIERKNNTNWKTTKEYTQIKLEKNATKIACILFKQWNMHKSYNMLKQVQKHITFETDIRVSKRAVPHLLFQAPDDITYSICYFEKSKLFKIFYPYPCNKQRMVICKSHTNVLEFFNFARNKY